MELGDFRSRHYTCVTLLPDRVHDLHSFAVMVEYLPQRRLPATIEVVELGTMFPDGRRLLLAELVVCISCRNLKRELFEATVDRFRRSLNAAETELLNHAMPQDDIDRVLTKGDKGSNEIH